MLNYRYDHAVIVRVLYFNKEKLALKKSIGIQLILWILDIKSNYIYLQTYMYVQELGTSKKANCNTKVIT